VTEVVIDISDEGEGVSPKDQTRIFDKFYRLGQQRAPHGAGLGLSIARGLVEAMGGDIRAEARNDGRNGLSLKVTLPRAAA
jgi:two-component system sensor histidine kinase KdpD